MGRAAIVHIGVVSPATVPPNVHGVVENIGLLLGDEATLDLIVGDDAGLSSVVRQQYDALWEYGAVQHDVAQLRYCVAALRDYLSQSRPDVLINASWPWNTGTVTAIMGRIYSVPVALRLTGDWRPMHRFAQDLPTKVRLAMTQECIANWIAPRLATNVLVQGDNMEGKLQGIGIDEQNIFQLPQPINTRKFYPSSGHGEEIEIRQKLGITEDATVILSVGRLDWIKGADRLVRVIERVVTGDTSVQFVIVGTGAYLERLKEYRTDSVKVCGEIDHSNIPLYYRASDLLLHLSRSEGLPNVILEAIASEVPVVATPTGEIPRYIDSTFDSIDSIVDYINAGAWSRNERPDWFDWEKQKAQYISCLSRVGGA